MAASHEIADSTDWLNTPLEGLSGLETALHCQICKEFYETPMITSCSHTFCSKCIRTSLSADGRCPTCRALDQASKLRNNWALEEAVNSFVRARPEALSAARQKKDVVGHTKRPGKRKRTIVESQDMETQESEGRTTRSKSRKVTGSQASQQEPVEITDSEDDGNFQAEICVDGLVNCPLGCGKRMKIELVDPHLDRCEDERKQASRSKSQTPINGLGGPTQSSRNSVKPHDRLAELNYSLLRDQGMRKKLEELGIPASGSKQLMVRRHIEWVNLWNANCDSHNPRTKRELLRDLDFWERTQGGKAPSNPGHLNGIMQKDFDGARWASKNKDEFSRLIADARRKNNNNSNPTASSDTLEKISGKSSHKSPSPSRAAPPPFKSDPQPYAENPEALASVRAKVKALNAEETITPVINEEFRSNTRRPDSEPVILNIPSHEQAIAEFQRAPDPAPGIDKPALAQNHFANDSSTSKDEHAVNKNTGSLCDLPARLQSSSRTVCMFNVPEQPLTDLDGTGDEAQI